jgi:hypothetical protein
MPTSIRILSALAACTTLAVSIVSFADPAALLPQDKYSVKVPGGLAFSEFRGYEEWQTISISHGGKMALILANSVMVKAYISGIPENGKPFPDGPKMAKIHWVSKQSADAPTPGPPRRATRASFHLQQSLHGRVIRASIG